MISSAVNISGSEVATNIPLTFTNTFSKLFSSYPFIRKKFRLRVGTIPTKPRFRLCLRNDKHVKYSSYNRTEICGNKISVQGTICSALWWVMAHLYLSREHINKPFISIYFRLYPARSNFYCFLHSIFQCVNCRLIIEKRRHS